MGVGVFFSVVLGNGKSREGECVCVCEIERERGREKTNESSIFLVGNSINRLSFWSVEYGGSEAQLNMKCM